MAGGTLTPAIIGYLLGLPLLIVLFSRRSRGKPIGWGLGALFLLSIGLIAANVLHIILQLRHK